MTNITKLAKHIKARDNPSPYTPMFGKIISLPELKIRLGTRVLLTKEDTATSTVLHRLLFAVSAVKCSAEFTGTIAAASPSSGAALAGWSLPVRNAMPEPSMKRY